MPVIGRWPVCPAWTSPSSRVLPPQRHRQAKKTCRSAAKSVPEERPTHPPVEHPGGEH